jgi:hypothetical protein
LSKIRAGYFGKVVPGMAVISRKVFSIPLLNDIKHSPKNNLMEKIL